MVVRGDGEMGIEYSLVGDLSLSVNGSLSTQKKTSPGYNI